MSRTIDERVVEMRFDNQQFEKNVSTSMSTLERLKQALNLSNVGKGLDGISDNIGKVDVSGLSGAVETVSSKFSVLETIAVGALLRIGSQAVDAGEKLVKSLSLDQITAGWDKYADKTSSIQTIMAATGETWEESAKALGFEGTQMEFVNSQLDKLNWFTDETSYNFLDMVNNIGKFTSNGIQLEDAVTSMEGIATWAALSGAKTQEASRAMYNFSQAMGAGAMKLQDWKSIENANMATMEFKQTVLDTAVEMGKLQKTENRLYYATETTQKKVTEFDIKSFSTGLKDAWFDADVMTSALERYGKFTDELNKFQGNDAIAEYYSTTSKLLSDLDAYQGAETAAEKLALLKEVSDETGVSVEELRKEFEYLNSEELDLGKRAFKAAQEAKTFQEAIDATKDAVSTAWMNTFEIIFGNYEEAKVIWTALSNELYDIFAEPINARNEMLAEWKEGGGRDMMIEGISNAWQGFKQVLDTVHEAFREVFPATTSEQLLKITEGFRNFTERMSMSEETASKVKNTFKGFFSVLDIGKQFLSAVLGGLKDLLGFLPGVGDGVLGVSSSFGEWISKVDETLKKNETFKKGVQTVVDFLKKIPGEIDGVFRKITGISIGDAFDSAKEKASGLLDKLKEVFAGFGKVDTSGIDTLNGDVEKKLSPIGTLFEGFKKLLSGIWEFLKSMAPVFSTIAKKLGEALGNVGDALKNAFQNASFDKLMELVKGGVLISLANSIRKFFDGFGKGKDGKGFAEMLSPVADVLDNVRGSLEQWQKTLKVGTLLLIAGAIGVLTLSLSELSKIDSDKLASAMAVMTGEFVELLASMAVIDKMSDGKGMTKIGTTMIGVAAAVLILSKAMKEVSDLNWDQVVQGLVTVGVLCAELSLFLKGADFDGVGVLKGVGLMAVAEAVNILAKAVDKFGQMDANAIKQGLLGVAAVLAELAIFTKLTGDAKHVISTAAGLLILGAAMNVMAGAIDKMGSMDTDTLCVGLLAMAGVLASVAAAMNAMPATTPLIAAGMLILGGALKVIASALSDFGSMTWDELGKGLLGLAFALTELGLAMAIMGTGQMMLGAATLVVASAALALLVPVLHGLGSLKWEQIAKGLVAIAGTFTVLGVASAVLAPFLPVILGLSAAIALLGVGMGAVGVGMFAFSAGLTTLSAAGTASINLLVSAIETIIGFIPRILTSVAQGIVQLIVTIGEAAPQLAQAAVNVASAIFTALTEAAPQIVSAVVIFIETTLQTLAEHAPEIIEAGFSLLMSLLQGISDHIGEIIDVAGDIIIGFMEGIAEKLPEVVQAGIDIVISLIDGLASGIEDNAERAREAFIHLFEACLNAIKTLLGIHSPSTVFSGYGTDMIQGLINGIGGMISSLVGKIGEVVSSMLKAITDKLGEFLTKGQELMTQVKTGIGNKLNEVRDKTTEVITNCVTAIGNKVNEFKEKGQALMDNVKTGISDRLSDVKSAAIGVANGALEGIRGKLDEFKELGKNLMDGLKSGISSLASKVADAAVGVARKAKNAIEEFTDTNSPSKVFAEIGGYWDQGLIVGLTKYSSDVAAASKEVASEAIDSMNSAINKMAIALAADVDYEPTIRPVLDLSNVERGTRAINGLLSSQRAVELADRTNFSLTYGHTENQNGLSVDNTDVVSELEKLREDMSGMMTAISRLRVVMDTGTLVGELSGPMDTALGFGL